jgi:hypothetical protein
MQQADEVEKGSVKMSTRSGSTCEISLHQVLEGILLLAVLIVLASTTYSSSTPRVVSLTYQPTSCAKSLGHRGTGAGHSHRSFAAIVVITAFTHSGEVVDVRPDVRLPER